jgi:hypothetical protein
MRRTEKEGSESALILSRDPSFDQVLDETCERLWDKKVRYSLRRLQELEDILSKMEQELNEMFL